MNNKKENGARSYKGSVIGDSMNLTINIKWLIQLFVFIAMIVYGWYQLETRIQHLERNMVAVIEQVEIYDQERRIAEAQHIEEIQEQLLWYESELNLNPFSWGKKRKK